MLKWKFKKKNRDEGILIEQKSVVTEIPETKKLEKDADTKFETQDTVIVSPFSMLPNTLKICAATLIGGRNYQQDTIWYGGRGQDALAVICDGMGGLEGGELASTCAISAIIDCYWQEDIPVKRVPSFLYQAMQMMNRAVCNLKSENGKTLECGTTVVSVYVNGNELFWLSVGDSKVYLIRGGKIICPFQPHNYRSQLDQFLKEGSLKKKEYEEELARGDALTSFLGAGALKIFEISQEPFLLKKGDIVLLCSDGLYKAISEVQILNIIDMCQDSFRKTADIFVQAVRDFGKKPLDNVSVICISYEGNEKV